MPRVNLTDDFVRKAKASPGQERTLYFDTQLKRFALVVTKDDAKSFVVQYRNAAGKSQRMKIGGVELKVAEARNQARVVLGDVARGLDPLAERRQEKIEAENTLASVVENYFWREGSQLRSAGPRQKAIKRLVLPTLGARQIGEIKRSEIVKLLDTIEDCNGPVMADQVLAYIRKIMAWHASRSDDFNSPVIRGMARTKPTERRRQRILTDEELRRVWRAASDMGGPFGQTVKVLLLTACRLREVTRMTRDELTGDKWTIPASRYKNKHDHVVPLSKAAQEIIASIPVINGSKWLFTNDGRKAIDGMSHYKRHLDELSGVSNYRLHDFRRTARSLMSRGGVLIDHAERCLGHLQVGVKGTYDRYAYLDEKRAAFEKLAGLIELIILNPASENVVELRKASNG